MVESISAADFAELLRTQGSDLRRVRIPRQRKVESAAYDPDDPRLRHDILARAGLARAAPSPGRVGLQLSLRAGPGPDRTPAGRVSVRDNTLHCFSYWAPDEARQVARQLMWAADQAELTGRPV